jgi:hypothetical protein
VCGDLVAFRGYCYSHLCSVSSVLSSAWISAVNASSWSLSAVT